jgi:hypothetical protein
MKPMQNSISKTVAYSLFSVGLRTISLFARMSGIWFNPFLLVTPCFSVLLSTTELLMGHFMAACLWSLAFPASIITLLHLPTLAASLFAQQSLKNNIPSKIFISTFVMCCAILFIVHPVGSVVLFYPLLWLPIVFSLFSNSLFFRSWGITLSAHAVGTIMYLYTHPTNPVYWLQLMPIAFVERLSSALVLYLVSTTIHYFISMITKSAKAVHAQTQI